MDAVVIASGPSLRLDDINLVRQWRAAGADRRVYVTNSTYKAAPWADVLFACDNMWWIKNFEEARARFKGELWTSSFPAKDRFILNFIPRTSGKGLSQEPFGVCGHDNSGSQAIELSYKQGARRITLLGFDFKLGAKGKAHWHVDHKKPLVNATNIQAWSTLVAFLAVDLLKAGVVLQNASRDTAIESIPRISLGEALRERVSDTATHR